ncbi:MAG: prepilin-type N-terminal cleavage/methylation domain-containing protein [Elusimicrobiaceae bacterium]|nr:prepilin-type N-terminal cleavage/methylation domain-containing protein [Elusimicrobiaceae bacterium]
MKKAFTLIELLVVVLIIGILSAIALPQYEKAVMRSRFATLKAATDALYQAEKIYFMANGTYTNDMTALDMLPSGCTLNQSKNQCSYPWGYCRAEIGTSYGRVHCENTQTLQNGYVHYFVGSFPETVCWAFTENSTDKYNQLCKTEGVYIGNGTCTKDFCRMYRM